jgi:hypothetical protein
MFLSLAALIAAFTLTGQPQVATPMTAAPAAAAQALPQPAPAQSTGPGTPTQMAAAEPVAPQQVCHREYTTGTRFYRTVCRTPAEVDNARTDSREMLRRMQGTRLPDGQ